MRRALTAARLEVFFGGGRKFALPQSWQLEPFAEAVIETKKWHKKNIAF